MAREHAKRRDTDHSEPRLNQWLSLLCAYLVVWLIMTLRCALIWQGGSMEGGRLQSGLTARYDVILWRVECYHLLPDFNWICISWLDSQLRILSFPTERQWSLQQFDSVSQCFGRIIDWHFGMVNIRCWPHLFPVPMTLVAHFLDNLIHKTTLVTG